MFAPPLFIPVPSLLILTDQTKRTGSGWIPRFSLSSEAAVVLQKGILKLPKLSPFHLFPVETKHNIL